MDLLSARPSSLWKFFSLCCHSGLLLAEVSDQFLDTNASELEKSFAMEISLVFAWFNTGHA